MLQVVILKDKTDKTDGCSHIDEIREMGTMSKLASFDAGTGKIDLSCLEGHVGERIMVSHYVKIGNETRIDYEHEKTLKELGTDENGLQYISYE